MTTVSRLYSAYKDSGVDWLCEIPKHWELPRLALVLEERREVNIDREVTRVLSVVRDRGVIPYEERGNMGNKKSDDITRYKVVRPNDIVVNSMNVIIGSVGVSRFSGCLSPVYYVLKTRWPSNRPEYFDAVFKVKPFQRSLSRIGNGILAHRMRISMNLLKCERVPRPPTDEQVAIVRYLSAADASISRFIRNRRRLIALLNEQKQAIINQAVTRGLDPNVRLKPSGVDWLGEIPEHWEVRKLKYLVSFSGGGTPAKAVERYWRGDIPWVSPKDMKCPMITDASDHISAQALESCAGSLVEPDALLLVVRSGILRRTIPTAINAVSVAINQDMKALRPVGSLSTEYLKLLIDGCSNRLLFEWTKSGATVESIEHEYLANTMMPVPPLDEQADIVAHADKESGPIATTIDLTVRQVDLVREYRTRLISDVVTGKVDVRGLAPMSEEEPIEPEAMEEDADSDDVPEDEEPGMDEGEGDVADQ